jgi:hypothetical protein
VAEALEGLGEVGLTLSLSSAASPPPPSHYADALSAILAIHNYRYSHLSCSVLYVFRSRIILIRLQGEKKLLKYIKKNKKKLKTGNVRGRGDVTR